MQSKWGRNYNSSWYIVAVFDDGDLIRCKPDPTRWCWVHGPGLNDHTMCWSRNGGWYGSVPQHVKAAAKVMQ